MYGTRESDNQVKSFSARNDDQEGHLADFIEDALFRATIEIRFRRLCEPQL